MRHTHCETVAMYYTKVTLGTRTVFRVRSFSLSRVQRDVEARERLFLKEGEGTKGNRISFMPHRGRSILAYRTEKRRTSCVRANCNW